MNGDGYRPPSAPVVGLQGELVKVVKDGGVGGDKETACTWTYAIYAATTPDDEITAGTATPLAEELTPERARMSVGLYTAAPDASLGWAVFLDDEWKLLMALGEVEGYGGCVPDPE